MGPVRRAIVIAGTAAVLTMAGESVGLAQAPPCAPPIAPCTSCHNTELTREYGRCMAEPWAMPASAKEATNPLPTSDRALVFAKATYEILCEGCHGATGDGRGAHALKHSLPSVDISSAVVQAQTDGELFWKISNGKGAMPSWQNMLPAEDRWRLVMFVRTFRRPAQ